MVDEGPVHTTASCMHSVFHICVDFLKAGCHFGVNIAYAPHSHLWDFFCTVLMHSAPASSLKLSKMLQRLRRADGTVSSPWLMSCLALRLPRGQSSLIHPNCYHLAHCWSSRDLCGCACIVTSCVRLVPVHADWERRVVLIEENVCDTERGYRWDLACLWLN